MTGRYFNKLFRLSLRMAFGFDRWHVALPSERPYVDDIISYCNGRSTRNSFIEIGCGLGDIVRHIQFNRRLGLDIDQRVLKAAKFLAKFGDDRQLRFDVFRFPDEKLERTADVIVLVNWIHLYNSDVLRIQLERYFHHHLNAHGELILDTVQDSGYANNHDVRYLTMELSCKIERLGTYAREREVWVVRKSSS